ncbi:hypothetical protein [Chitinophaga sp. OAE865]|uniref:hypothetical protein n=1 Tax=Chitinophaga sp. OAE865 TaxID=2817898 RepID=UPI001AE8FE83
MKKAKFALTAVAVLAVIGGALAFKANRQVNHFYSLGQAVIDGQPVSGCVVDKTLQLTPVAAGGFITTLYSSTISIGATTCTARVTNNG